MFSSTYIVIHADHIWNSSCCTIYGVTKSFWVGPFLYPINRNLKLITKRKAVLVCTMKTHIWGVELHLLLFWTSALCGGKRRSSSSGYFPHGKEHRCPLNRRLGGPQSQPGCFGEEKKNLFPATNRIGIDYHENLSRKFKCGWNRAKYLAL